MGNLNARGSHVLYFLINQSLKLASRNIFKDGFTNACIMRGLSMLMGI